MHGLTSQKTVILVVASAETSNFINKTTVRDLKVKRREPWNICNVTFRDLTLYLLTWRIWRAPNNASKGQTGFNSAFKGLTTGFSVKVGYYLSRQDNSPETFGHKINRVFSKGRLLSFQTGQQSRNIRT